MRHKLYLVFLSAFFIIIVATYLPIVYERAAGCNGWTVGDWLINFDGGFVRRGLGGYLIIALSDLINLKPNFTVAIIQAILFLIYISILFNLIYRKKINGWFLLMLLSPATLLFPVLDSSTVGRKEVLLFCLFAVYILYLHQKTTISKTAIFLFSFFLMVATLFHELVFFYLPYFVFAAYIQSKVNKNAFLLSQTLLIIFGSFLIMIPILLFGQNIHGEIICKGLLERGLAIDICKGVLEFPQDFDTISFYKEKGYYLPYFIAFVLGLVPFIFFVKNSEYRIVRKTIFIGFIAALLFSAPLFVLAIDWGRWINIHLVLLLLTCTLLLKDRSLTVDNNTLDGKLVIPDAPKPQKTGLKVISNLFFLILSVAYGMLWYIPGCCSPNLLHNNFYIVSYKWLSEIFLQP